MQSLKLHIISFKLSVPEILIKLCTLYNDNNIVIVLSYPLNLVLLEQYL